MSETKEEWLENIFKKTNGACCICEYRGPGLDKHHIVFRGGGGSDHSANRVLICGILTDGQCHDKLHHSAKLSQQYREIARLYLGDPSRTYANKEEIRLRKKKNKKVNEKLKNIEKEKRESLLQKFKEKNNGLSPYQVQYQKQKEYLKSRKKYGK